jgi:hypothetical protein
MKRMKRWIVPAWLLLAGCVVTGLNSGLQALVGQDITAAVKVLGYPNGARSMTAGTLYIWSTGSVGSVPNEQTCTIQITVDATNRIKRGEYNGNRDACAPYERELNTLGR